MITAEQRLLRRQYAGSSDAPIICGLSPWDTPADLWLKKTGRVEDAPTTDAMESGNRLEEALIRYCSDTVGQDFSRDVERFDDSGLLVAHLDAMTFDEQIIVEAKTSGDPDGWGEQGTDQIPEHYLAQVMHQFAVVPSARLAYVPVLLFGFRHVDWRIYRVERDDSLAGIVAHRCREFMERHVRADVPPAQWAPSLDVLRRMKRERVEKPIAADLVAKWLEAKEAVKAAEDAKAEAERLMLDALGNAEVGVLEDGSGITYLSQSRKSIDQERLKLERPDVASEYIKESKFRVLRHKSAKKGKQ